MAEILCQCVLMNKTNGRAISYATYAYFAKKYKIPLSSKGKRKTMRELSTAIYLYEMENIDTLFKKLDKNTGTYGLYLID